MHLNIFLVWLSWNWNVTCTAVIHKECRNQKQSCDICSIIQRMLGGSRQVEYLYFMLIILCTINWYLRLKYSNTCSCLQPVDVWTKHGRHGRVKEPVGTHGTLCLLSFCYFNEIACVIKVVSLLSSFASWLNLVPFKWA